MFRSSLLWIIEANRMLYDCLFCCCCFWDARKVVKFYENTVNFHRCVIINICRLCAMFVYGWFYTANCMDCKVVAAIARREFNHYSRMKTTNNCNEWRKCDFQVFNSTTDPCFFSCCCWLLKSECKTTQEHQHRSALDMLFFFWNGMPCFFFLEIEFFILTKASSYTLWALIPPARFKEKWKLCA